YDLIWAKLEGYPYWPSIVCPHPKTSDIRKIEQKVDKLIDYVHVQFFDDPPQRSWIPVNDTVPYTGPQHPIHKIIVNQQLKKAIEYCEEAMKMEQNNRYSLIVELQLSDDDDDDSIKVDNKESGKDETKNSSKKTQEAVICDSGQDDVLNNNSSRITDKRTPKRKGQNSKVSNKRRRVIVFSDEDDSSEINMKINSNRNDKGDSEYKPPDESSSEGEEMSIDEVNLINEELENDIPIKPKKSKSSISNLNNSAKKLNAFLADSEYQNKTATYSIAGDWPHLKFPFLQPENIRDADGRRRTDPAYNPKTLYVPKDFLQKQTPALKQWWEMKSKHFDTILFFKMGKFYEMFHMDAVIGINELQLLPMKGDNAHAGFPEASYSRYSDRLLRSGYKVARIEQTERPEQRDERCKQTPKADKVVAREICRITTPATRTSSVLDADPDIAYIYLYAIAEKVLSPNNVEFGICFVETTVGLFYLGKFNDDKHRSRLRNMFAIYTPGEILLQRGNVSEETTEVISCLSRENRILKEELEPEKEFWSASHALKFIINGSYFNENEHLNLPDVLSEMISTSDGNCFNVKPEFELTFSAFGAIIYQLKKCLIEEDLLTLKSFERYFPADQKVTRSQNDQQYSVPHLILDSVSLKNLEIFTNSCGGKEGTLMESMNHCRTKFGSRLMREWLCSPLCDVALINSRLDALEDLMLRFKANDAIRFNKLLEILRELPDFERCLTQIHSQGSYRRNKDHPDARAVMFEADKYSKRKINDFLSTLKGFRKAHQIVEMFSQLLFNFKSDLLKDCTRYAPEGKFPNLTEELDFFDNAFDHEEAKEKGKIIPKPGVDEDYDQSQAEMKLFENKVKVYLEEQRKFFGCKVNFYGSGRNRFQLEVPDNNARKANADYEYSSSRKGFKRYMTAKTKEFLREIVEIEGRQEEALADIMRRIFEKFDAKYAQWMRVVKCLSILDCLLSLVECCDEMKRNGSACCRPKFIQNEKPFLSYKEGKHPSLLKHCDNFIANDLELNEKLILITGPNMGGKSTLMRQTALIIVMAHIGAYVPARECSLTLVDRIFTRLGASDRILEGQSTFYVELSETSAILHHATNHSLVILDELGRGTATYDGTAIAYSVISELSGNKKCRSLFSTHYHSLIDEFVNDENVKFMHMACKVESEDVTDPTNDVITFLYQIKPGFCPKSYGFNAAKLAGINNEVIKRGYKVSQKFECAFLAKQLLIENLGAEKVRSLIEQIRKVSI
ncbi:DNA mismatch repair protein Msh6-like protein, partial [Dinothrombium tinctorium]